MNTHLELILFYRDYTNRYTSSPYVYEINEGGIIPDYIIPLAQIFDPEILKEIIYGLRKAPVEINRSF